MNANQIRSELAQNVLNRPTQEGCNLALIEIAAQLAELNAQLRAITDNEPDHVPHIRVGAEVTGDVTNHY